MNNHTTFYRLITVDGYWTVVKSSRPISPESFISNIYDEKERPHEVIGSIILENFDENSEWCGWDNLDQEEYSLEVCPKCGTKIWTWVGKPGICADCHKLTQ